MRHGDALSAAVDPRRPLSARGREEVEEIARLAAARKVRVAAIYHSGIERARETAEILAQHLAPEQGVGECAGLCPDDDPAIGQAELEAAAKPIMLVSHLPYIGKLAALLVAGDPERSVVQFAPAMMVCCAKTESRWEIAWTIAPSQT
jgi:phosphohistidine phosphatase